LVIGIRPEGVVLEISKNSILYQAEGLGLDISGAVGDLLNKKYAETKARAATEKDKTAGVAPAAAPGKAGE
jgi:hypothetical protein